MEKIDICNNALVEAHIDSTITNMNESSPEAERFRRIYDPTRRELLSMYPWGFANKFVKLSRAYEDVEGYDYAYKYPSEALRINDIYINELAYKKRDHIKFDMADAKVSYVNNNKCIVCNYKEPFVSMNVDVTREDLFPPHFVRLFYLMMALKIAKMSGAGQNIISEINDSISTQFSFSSTISNREESEGKDFFNYYVDVRS